jgi:hypothetical protein
MVDHNNYFESGEYTRDILSNPGRIEEGDIFGTPFPENGHDVVVAVINAKYRDETLLMCTYRSIKDRYYFMVTLDGLKTHYKVKVPHGTALSEHALQKHYLGNDFDHAQELFVDAPSIFKEMVE